MAANKNTGFENNTTNIGSSFVHDKLKEWDLEAYIETFDHHQIDKEIFLTLPNEAIAEIITVIGPRFKFLKRRKEYLDSLESQVSLPNVPEKSTKTNSSINSSPSTSNSSKLKLILEKTSDGRDLLLMKKLEPTSRDCLTEQIIEYYRNNDLKIDKDIYIQLTEQILAIWPHERKDTYYTPSKDGRPPSGKLFDKYHNKKKKRNRNVKKGTENSGEDNAIALKTKEEILLSLKSIALDDLVKWRQSWKETHELRKCKLSIAEYFDEYPVLKTSIGSSLISIDYECLGVSESNIFFTKWSTISKYIVRYSQNVSACKDILKNNAKVKDDVLALLLLPYLFKPKTYKRNGKKPVKTTLQEQSDAFILWINDIVELHHRISNIQSCLKANGLTFQPTVIAVGQPQNISKLYVMINETKFEFSELTAAVDFCFKSFYALRALYPRHCESVWTFLQVYIYEIGKTKKSIISVSELISDLNYLISQDSTNSELNSVELEESEDSEKPESSESDEN